MWIVADRLCQWQHGADCIFFYMYQGCLRVQKVGDYAKLINGPLCIFCDYA